MNDAVRDCLVVGYEELVPSLTLPDPDDRHVLAAIYANADIILTFNIKDFPPATLSGFGIGIMHPDDWLLDLFEALPGPVRAAVKLQRESLRNPPKTAEEMLATLAAQGLPQFVARLSQFAASL